MEAVALLLSADSFETAVEHLTAVDPVLGKFITQHRNKHGDCPIRPIQVRSLFVPLSRSIIYQQLSGKAAGTIYGRFRDLFPQRRPSATRTLSLSYEVLRGAGLSNNKTLAVQDLAQKVVSRQLPAANRITTLDDATLIESITQVRGIGVWTVQMFLMSSLARPNILPVADLGIQKGLQQLYQLEVLPTPEVVAEIGKKWSPWASLAAWYLWRRTEL